VAQQEKRRTKKLVEKASPQFFSLALFRAAPQLTERLEEAISLGPHDPESIGRGEISRPKN